MSGRVVVAGGIGVEETIRRSWLTGQDGAWIGHRHDLRVGGAAALAAVAAAAVGATARCVGMVGTDPAGAACRRHLARADVDVTTVMPTPGPTSRILRVADWSLDGEEPMRADEGSPLGDLLVLPGSGWGVAPGSGWGDAPGSGRGDVAASPGHALRGCEPGDVLLVDWSARDGLVSLVETAHELDLQIVALMAPYAAVSWDFDLRIVDVAVVDIRGAAWLADAGQSAASLCVIVGGQGLSWDGGTILAPELAGSAQPLDRAYAVLAGALAGRLALGDDRNEAGEAALRARVAYDRGLDAAGSAGLWPRLRLDLEELG